MEKAETLKTFLFHPAVLLITGFVCYLVSPVIGVGAALEIFFLTIVAVGIAEAVACWCIWDSGIWEYVLKNKTVRWSWPVALFLHLRFRSKYKELFRFYIERRAILKGARKNLPLYANCLPENKDIYEQRMKGAKRL
jgi:hypothetical protein